MTDATEATDPTDAADWSNVNMTAGDGGRIRLESARNSDAWIEADANAVNPLTTER